VINFTRILEQGWVRSAQWYPTIDSTNSQLRRELSEFEANASNDISAMNDAAIAGLPRLIVADEQTAGRGRGDHTWWSPEGCLMSSIAIHANSEQALCIPYLVAIAIAQTIESQLEGDSRCKIKWPNDVYVDDRKIAGVLIEQLTCRSQSIWIIGTGINVDVDFTRAPTQVQSKAVSLSTLLAPIASRSLRHEEWMTEILTTFIVNLRKQLLETQANPTAWRSEWSNRCYLFGKTIEATVSDWDRNFTEQTPPSRSLGVCLGLDQDGHLLILHESGSIGKIVTGSVRIVQNGIV